MVFLFVWFKHINYWKFNNYIKIFKTKSKKTGASAFCN